jgi:hypothetical protein
MICYEGQHMIQVAVLAMPAIVIWIFGMPIIAFILLTKHKKTIAQIHQQESLSKSD